MLNYLDKPTCGYVSGTNINNRIFCGGPAGSDIYRNEKNSDYIRLDTGRHILHLPNAEVAFYVPDV